MQKILIEGYEYEVLEIKEKVTIADSFVVRSNKIGTGNGEAKLYVGNDNPELRQFFGSRPFAIKCFLLKKDLITYLEDTEVEYRYPEQPYQDRMRLPILWEERNNRIRNLNANILEFEVYEQDQISGPRIYVKSQDDNYQIIRELSIPNITYISILKLRNLITNDITFYFRLFADYFGENEHPAIAYKEEQEILVANTIPTEKEIQLLKARRGHGKYRTQLLELCPFCPITLITDDRLLIASHIRPWAKSNDFEKTDPYNGFMLSPTFDYLFDKGFMSFTDDKRTILSPFLSKMTYSKIGINNDILINKLPIDGRENYLEYHRTNILKIGGDIYT